MLEKLPKAHRVIFHRVNKGLTIELFGNGELSPYCEIARGKNVMLLQPPPINDDKDKAIFVTLAHNISLLKRADSLAFVVETWCSTKEWPGRPSEDPNRKECVAVLIETYAGHSVTRFDIVRAPDRTVMALPFWDEVFRKKGTNKGNKQGLFEGVLATVAEQNDPVMRLAAEQLLRTVLGRVPVPWDQDEKSVKRGAM